MYLNLNYMIWTGRVGFMICLLVQTTIIRTDDILDFFDNATEMPSFLCTANVNPADVVALLVEDLDALCILQQDFYLHTNELNQRNLLDYGLFLAQKFCAHPWDIGAHLFYNQTTRDNYTRASTKLCSYLAIFQDSFLQEIQNRIESLDLNLPVDLRDAVPLFRNMTVQERRLGLMFHGIRRFNSARFRFWIPFYYNEANLFLTPEELDTIQANLGITDPADDDEFARKHLIADQVGFGDLRLNLDFPFARTGSINSKLGILMTIPTAYALKKGLYGSSFKKSCRGPLLDFCNLFYLAVQQMDFALVQMIVEQYAIAALNHFDANLIETPLGNNGHVGLGCYLRSKTPLHTLIKRPWAEHINIHSYISFEYLFPKKETRYFIQTYQQNAADFKALGLDRSPATISRQAAEDPFYARTVLGFLENQFTDRLFPFGLRAEVRPGMIFRWVTRYMYEEQRWGYYVGSDSWLTTKEKLSKIEIPKGFPSQMNKKIAKKPFGYQVGAMGNLFWKLPHNHLVSLNMEYNFSSIGIGYDYLISVNLEHVF